MLFRSVASTVDPLGGSWFVESLTNRTERAVWAYLDEIDRRGGMVAAVIEGYPQREIADAAYRFQRAVDAGARRPDLWLPPLYLKRQPMSSCFGWKLRGAFESDFQDQWGG